jgi:bifunctional non-homologous end joining protein LigD
MDWDKGTYETDGSAAEQLAQGELKFVVHGKKLRGGFVLIRTGLKSARARSQRSWLLIKRQDEFADPAWNIDRYDWSVLTGRSLEEIAAGLPRRAISRTRSLLPTGPRLRDKSGHLFRSGTSQPK